MYLVRHGATANNVANPPRLQGARSTAELSSEGRAQAEAAATLLADRPIGVVYTSPLIRAKQTADIIAAGAQRTPQVVQELIEVDVGDWEDRDWTEIERSEPEAYRRFIDNPAVHTYAGGENLQQVSQRILPVMSSLMQQNVGKAIVVVAHNVVNRVYLATLMQLPLALARSIPQQNGGINVIRWRAGEEKLITTNAAFHLGSI
jgi:broad specificity phosphatase PhoE